MDDAGDVGCNLQCMQGPQIREFVGPVKILLVEPIPFDYCRKAWGSGLIAVGNILMATDVMIVLISSLIFYLPVPLNVHLAICTIAYQLLMPSGILMVNPLFGPTAHLKFDTRRFQHAFLQCVSFVSGTAAVIYVYVSYEEYPINIHSISGLLTAICAGLAVLLGPFVYYMNPRKPHMDKVRYFHIFFGLTAFVCSSISFCSGFLKLFFKQWSQIIHIKDMPIILYTFCVIYTIIFVFSVYIRAKVDA